MPKRCPTIRALFVVPFLLFACDGTSGASVEQLTSTVGKIVLRYDPATGAYAYLWKTEKQRAYSRPVRLLGDQFVFASRSPRGEHLQRVC